MKIDSIDKLYIESLRDLYSAETQLTKALPKVAKAATAPELKAAVESHLKETQGQVERLEKIFKDLGEKPTGHTCAAMKGLIEEADEMIKEVEDPQVLDAGLIGGAQKVEHYEIAGYGTAIAHARMLGRDTDAELLSQTLEEESACDEKLTEIAMSGVNQDASKEKTNGRTSSSNGKSSDSKSGTTKRQPATAGAKK